MTNTGAEGSTGLHAQSVDAVRFAVGSVEGPRSSTWRVWGNKKGDFYFSTRTLGGVIKTSLHKDGNCFSGFTREYRGKPGSIAPAGRSRHVDRWVLPDEPWCCAARILIPKSELRTYTARPERKMRWLEAPQVHDLFMASLYVIQPGAAGSRWPGADRGSIPIGILATRERSLWVVGSYPVSDDATVVWLAKQRERAAARFQGVERKSGLRAVLGGAREDDGVRWLMEMAWQDD